MSNTKVVTNYLCALFSQREVLGMQPIGRLGLHPNEVHSSLSHKIEMPPWIDEWQMSHFHLWASECSNSSVVMSCHDWNVFFLYEINRNERKEKRGWEHNDEILAAIFFHPSCVPRRGPTPFTQPESWLFHPVLWHGRCVSEKKRQINNNNKKVVVHPFHTNFFKYNHFLMLTPPSRIHTTHLPISGDCSIL